jgi:hypothetical protein
VAVADEAQLIGDIVGAIPAVVGIFGQAPLDGPVERRWRHRLKLGDWLRLARHDRADEARLALAHEGPLARRHLVQHAAESPDVGAMVGLLSLELLGRHVLERPEHRAFAGEGLLAGG